MGILDDWIKDMPQQFQGKERIEAVISAFARQIEELYRVFRQLDTETDLEGAVGMNLDMVGNIITLTRKEAGILAGINVEDPVISDERYRQFLKYQMLKNTCECTYEDVVDSIFMLWKVKNISYIEPETRPATIFIGLPTFDIDVKDPAVERTLAIKAAGVSMIYIFRYSQLFYSNTEDIKVIKIRLYIRVSFWDIKTYNSTFYYNGTFLYDNNARYRLVLGLKTMSKIHNNGENIANVMFITKRNPCFYNGSAKYNSSKIYNAIYREEVIE